MERAAHCLREGLQAGCLDGAQVPELHDCNVRRVP